MENGKIRFLTYNVHLMKDSAIDRIASTLGKDPVVFEDDVRRARIVEFIQSSNADVVALQEVWAESWQKWFIDHFRGLYPYSVQGDTGTIASTTSGLILLSKFPLSDYYFDKYGNMKDDEAWSAKGILCITATLPGDKSFRIGLTHATTDTGGDNCRDLEVLAWHTVTKSAVYKDMPAVILGDFNAHANKYPVVKKIMQDADATDSWMDVHGENDPDGSYTVDMRNNTLDQFFSPDRGTADPSRIDYLFVKKSGKKFGFKPVAAEVKRDLKYASGKWYWAHGMTTRHLPSSTVMKNDLYVAAYHYGSGRHNALPIGRYISHEKKWYHYFVNSVHVSGSPGIIFYQDKLHVYYRDPNGNGVFHITSEDGWNWKQSDPLYQGFDTGGGCSPVMYDGKLYLFYVDPDGNEGGRVYYRTLENGKWSGPHQVMINTRHDISAAVLGNKLCIVTKDNGGGSSGLMYGVLDRPGGSWQTGRVRDTSTSGSPGIIARDGQFHVYYRDPGGNAIFHIYSQDGITWSQASPHNTGRDVSSGAVLPMVYEGKTLVFYPRNGYSGHPNIMSHFEDPNIGVDLSDHYPYIVDLEVI